MTTGPTSPEPNAAPSAAHENASNADAATLISLLRDPVELTAALCDIPSVSGDERRITDAVNTVLEHIGTTGVPLDIRRDGDTIVASTNLGRSERIVVAGHLDTVPIEDNVPSERRTLDDVGAVVWGRGACDMKSGVAMQLACAAALRNPVRDVTWVFYDHEEVDAALNGLGRVTDNHPDWITGDLAILGEPSNAGIEGGCNGTIRVEVATHGVRAHSARAFKGVNAIHKAAPILDRLAAHTTDTITVDGLDYIESLSAVGIRGGVAGNVVPDECVVTVNYRFAPDKTPEHAESWLREFFTGFDVTVTDVSAGARPGLDRPAAIAFARALSDVPEVGATPAPKLGWTDVARFSELGIPALNFGPGDALFAHKADEHVSESQVLAATAGLLAFLEPHAATGAAR